MIVFAAYLFLILALILYNGFFGLFKELPAGRRNLAFFFALKAAAVPVFYFLYRKWYGGVEGFDAGKFWFDARILAQFGKQDPLAYLQCLFGMQDESVGSYFYKCIHVPTFNWDNGQLRDFFYNDNRIVIRVHSIFEFIAFGSYFAHALFSCFLSFIGIYFIHSAFRPRFKGKEWMMMAVLCLFPSLWLYTGAPLKEGLCMFVLGLTIHSLKRNFVEGFSLGGILKLCVLLFISLLLKPYILLTSFLFFSFYFLTENGIREERRMITFAAALFFFTLLANFGSMLFRSKSLWQAAEERRKEFADLSEGGIFLLDSVKFVRLSYDLTQVVKYKGIPRYSIRKNVPYTYWEHTHQKDTLFCAANTDTLTRYSMVYMIPKAGSNIPLIQGGKLAAIFLGFYYTIAHPFFYNAKGPVQMLASLENLALMLAFLLVLFGIFRHKEQGTFLLAILLLVICVFVIIGYTTPNTGAIVRYRAPLAALLLLGGAISWLGSFRRRS